MAQAQKTSEKASVAPTEGNLKRAIQMKMFATDTIKARLALAKAENRPDEECQQALGQIVGMIAKVEARTFEDRDGNMQEQLVALGDFEAVVYETGEVMNSTNAYLPRYYLEGVKAVLDKPNVENVLCGIEIVLVATGKSIPVAYEVRNLVQRQRTSPLNLLKEEMAKAGRLRLPAPPKVDEAPATGEIAEQSKA